MKKFASPLIAFLFVWSFVPAQQISFSVTAKANYSSGINGSLNDTPAFLFDFIDFNNPNLDQFFPSPIDDISESGFAFEVGVDARLPLTDRFSLTTGIFFQQLRYKLTTSQIFVLNPSSPNSPIFSPSSLGLVTSRRLDYFKIPFGVEYALVRNKLFVQGGFFGGMLYATDIKVKDSSGREVPLQVTDFNGNIIQ